MTRDTTVSPHPLAAGRRRHAASVPARSTTARSLFTGAMFTGAVLTAVMLAPSLLAPSIMTISTATAAEPAKPSAVDMLFERPHLAKVDAGGEIVYRFERTVSRADLLGQAFSDDVKVAVRKVAPDGTREVDIRVFSGERARDPQVIDGLTINPILVVFLDRSVSTYMSVAGGKLPYLKDRFRTALRDRAVLEPTMVKIDGRSVEAVKVTVQPYVGDPNASRMQGFEGARFTIIVSESVPGHFVELVASYDNTRTDGPRIEERLAMAGAEVVR